MKLVFFLAVALMSFGSKGAPLFESSKKAMISLVDAAL